MKKVYLVLVLYLLLFSCTSRKTSTTLKPTKADFTIAFGSCNKTNLANEVWDDVLAAHPDVWIWGGDNIYADTDNMGTLRYMYAQQDSVPGYAKVKSQIPVIGTWDDHDYGLNDGGVEFSAKKESQQEFMDFMDVPQNSPRRQQEGVYTSHDYDMVNGKVRIIVLDTRYFRTSLTPDTDTKKRNKPNRYGEGTILGEKQWKWLKNELKASDADFNVLVTSIQFLSNEHGFECWGNFPHEVDKMKKTIKESGAKGVLFLSGDRHISEFSRDKTVGLSYPLIDFTSSGLTHAYRGFSGEPNPFRVGEVIATESFGVVGFNFADKVAHMKIIGVNGDILGELQQSY
ncbi:alkaline phosphatase D family protein [Costertonia aggregata]|uniref:Alkaline phosphatase family protein n=1 Tax=Costertonia aggregata TaxID=343403 RepID=A0A7H9AL22_9FLAO|nr:alkaline phosphatase D family protein [Costertonia aggregata]QLG44097.1 alkaline phosphatase family protein [Costertonia aggregata]